jgi:hypothetical protein
MQEKTHPTNTKLGGGKSLPHPPKGTGRAYKGVNMIPSIKKTISFLIIRGGGSPPQKVKGRGVIPPTKEGSN